MSDVHNKTTRSYNMSRIKGRDTKPEMLVRRWLFRNGLRYRLHDKKLPGKPDLVFVKQKTVLFINGCFWHGHEECKYFKVPRTRTDWWLEKITKNVERDINNYRVLTESGWQIVILWECELKQDSNKILEELLLKLKLKNGSNQTC